MNRRLFLLCAAVLLVGQGCFAAPQSVPLEEIAATATATPDGMVAFRTGFGQLPGTPPSFVSRPQPTVILEGGLPTIPPDVTVLREWNTSPDTHLLRNMTTAFNVPSGAFGASPQTEALTLSWRDGTGYAWTYAAPEHALRTERLLPAASPFTGEVDQINTKILATTRDFLSVRGVDTAGWGVPIVHTSSSGAWRVTYAASRDEQTVMYPDGHSLLAGSVEGTGDSVTRAFLELPRSLDRSNYPALTEGEVLRRLRAGGTNPLPTSSSGASVSFETFRFVLYRHEGVVGGSRRLFYIPALQASGTLRQEGTVSPHTTLVPLVADSAFGQ
jgi:hypothetical protein